MIDFMSVDNAANTSVSLINYNTMIPMNRSIFLNKDQKIFMENVKVVNFSLKELKASSMAKANGITNEPPIKEKKEVEGKLEQLMKVLQLIRNKYGNAIIISSGYRCEKLNSLVGGVKNSQHMRGEAADLQCSAGKSIESLWDLIVQMIKNGEIEVGQLLWETNKAKGKKWIHISIPFMRDGKLIKNEIKSIKV